MTAAAPLSFVPPSPGAWELEQTHVTRPISVYMADVFPAAMVRGFTEGAREFGVLLDHLEIAVLNRFIYMAPRPVGAPKNAKGAPPRAVFEIVRRLHPEIRRRVRRAEVVFRDRLWRAEAARWYAEIKPSIAAEAKALLQQDLSQCSTTELAEHIRRATDFAKRTIFWHHRLNFCAMVPVGDLLVHTIGWTGMPAGEILQVLRGLSAVSAGAVEELAAVQREMRNDPEALALLTSNRPAADVIAALEARPTTAGEAVRAYTEAVGLRILGGYDVADHHAREHPEMLVKTLRAAVTADDTARKVAAEQAVASIRGRIPEAHRAEFDELLKEAQATYGVRDDRVINGDAIGLGIARRAILAAGDRLKATGRIGDPSHLVDATADEICAMLEERGGPSAKELTDRSRFRLETPISVAPAQLGNPPSPPPPAHWLPPAAARLQRIVELVMSLMFDPRPVQKESRNLKGFGVSAGVYEGVARVIRSIDELPSIQQGEVLVALSTGSTFNVVLPLLGAIVTERGGALSHAAIVAREYGLPGVVGCPGATRAIQTGQRVHVDGTTGDVWAID